MGKIVKMVAFLASLAAVVGLIVSIWQIHHDLKEYATEEWKEVAVYSVCVEAGSKGATLEEVRQRYRESAKDLPEDPPREALTTDAIKRALISLIAKNAVGLRPDGTYAAQRVPPLPEALFKPVRSALQDKAAGLVMRVVREQPHKYTRQQLQEQVSKEIPT